MSTDYEAGVILGWHIDLDHFKGLCEQRDPVAHSEKRFDPKTGEETEPEVVIDEPGGLYWHGEHIPCMECVCQVVQGWLNEQGGRLEIVSFQPTAHGALNGFFIGKNCDEQTTFDAGRSLCKDDVLLAKKHFKVDGMPRILSYLVVS